MQLPLSPHRFRQAVCIVILAMPGWFGVHDVQASEVASRYKIQAGFLIHLTSYVYWPTPSEKRTICIGKGHRFGRFLHDLAAIKQFNDNGERLVVKNVAVSDDLTICDVLYAPLQLHEQFSELLSGAAPGTLTVSDSPGFISTGGAMEFYMSGQNVRMRAHRGHLHHRNLELSSDLLQLVDIVDSTQALQQPRSGGT